MGTAIAARPAPSTSAPHRWIDASTAVVLSSNGHDMYLVEQIAPGRYKCDCKGFGFRGTCRHIATITPAHYCQTCGTERVANEAEDCAGCAAIYGTSGIAIVQEQDNTPVTETAIYRETLAELPGILAAERNAQAMASHRFERGTRLATHAAIDGLFA